MFFIQGSTIVMAGATADVCSASITKELGSRSNNVATGRRGHILRVGHVRGILNT